MVHQNSTEKTPVFYEGISQCENYNSTVYLPTHFWLHARQTSRSPARKVQGLSCRGKSSNLYTRTWKELKIQKSHAKTVVLSLTANNPKIQVSPRRGNRTILSLRLVLWGIPEQRIDQFPGLHCCQWRPQFMNLLFDWDYIASYQSSLNMHVDPMWWWCTDHT